MKTLDRYLLRSFLTNYLLALFVLISMYVVLDLSLNLDEFTEGGKDFSTVAADIADYYFYNLPFYFWQLSGVITLMAACLTLARMQYTNELTAILASGTSLYRVAAPIIAAGMAMNALIIADQEFILPHVATKLARSRDDVEGRIANELWCVKDGSNLISAQYFQPSPGRMRNLIVVELSLSNGRSGGLNDVIQADKADWNPARRGWDLTKGRRYTIANQNMRIVPTYVDFYPTQLAPEDLVLRRMSAWNRFLSTSQLNQLVARGDLASDSINKIRHARFTLPINNMILLLLGMAFFLNRLPSSVLNQAAKALLTCATAFVLAFAGQGIMDAVLAVSGGSWPFWITILPPWLPIFLFGPVAILLLDNVKT